MDTVTLDIVEQLEDVAVAETVGLMVECKHLSTNVAIPTGNTTFRTFLDGQITATFSCPCGRVHVVTIP